MIELLFLYLLFCLLGMAKVTGPLFSIEARGKIADAMVHFPWKGLCVVREWKVPSNPKTPAQGDARLILGGLGRSTSPVHTQSDYAGYARAVTPSGQTWVSRLVQFMRDTYMATVANFDTWHDAVESHAASGDFLSEAVALGLVLFDYDPKTAANLFAERAMLYALANYGCAQYILDNSKFAVAPYTKAIADWLLADIQLMVADFAAP